MDDNVKGMEPLGMWPKPLFTFSRLWNQKEDYRGLPAAQSPEIRGWGSSSPDRFPALPLLTAPPFSLQQGPNRVMNGAAIRWELHTFITYFQKKQLCPQLPTIGECVQILGKNVKWEDRPMVSGI
jgi:hypothetical protein